MKPENVGAPPPRSWLLLIHSLPARPLYLRARIRRRLGEAGAVALKRSVYALPPGNASERKLRQIAEEASAGGGEAHVCVAEFRDGKTDAALVETSRQERGEDWSSLAREVGDAIASVEATGGVSGSAAPAESLARAVRRADEIAKIDFFDAPGRAEAETRVRDLERLLTRKAKSSRRSGGSKKHRARVWVTRRRVHVDRIASAWLIRRFLDPGARFRFIDPTDPPLAGELRFDVPGGDFSHEGDACTFETLAHRAGLEDPALRAVAEIVHDIDLKDGKFGRTEAPGIERLLNGILMTTADDEERFERGFRLFDELHGSFLPVAARKEGRK